MVLKGSPEADASALVGRAANPGSRQSLVLPAFLISFDGGSGYRASPNLVSLCSSRKVVLSRGFPIQNVGLARDTVIGIRSDRSSSVSREHAWLFVGKKNNQWLIQDRASRNGTFVNRHRLTPKTSYVLNSGDRIDICDPDAQLAAASFVFVQEKPLDLFGGQELFGIGMQPGLLDSETFAVRVSTRVEKVMQKLIATSRDDYLQAIKSIVNAALAKDLPENLSAQIKESLGHIRRRKRRVTSPTRAAAGKKADSASDVESKEAESSYEEMEAHRSAKRQKLALPVSLEAHEDSEELHGDTTPSESEEVPTKGGPVRRKNRAIAQVEGETGRLQVPTDDAAKEEANQTYNEAFYKAVRSFTKLAGVVSYLYFNLQTSSVRS